MTTTPPQQYCLRWNNYQNNLTNVFDQLLQNGSFVDVTLACDGHSLKAHKMVLSACSPYFQTLFFDNPCKHPIVILKDVRWEELKAVVEFMYRGEINVSQEQLSPLLKVAESLKIRGLADVSRGSSADFVAAAAATSGPPLGNTKTSGGSMTSVPGRPVHHSESDGEGPLRHHRHPFLTTPPSANGHGQLRGSLGRKRRRLSDDRSLSPPDTLDDHSNQLEIDSNHGDYADGSPLGNEPPPLSHSNSRSVNPSPGMGPGTITHGPPSSNSLNSIGSHSLLSLHNAAAAAAAAAAAVGGTSSTVTNEMDLKPGIVEMIREEERAKMLESSHGWLGPSVASTLSDSYQYQIQSLWQKCWNTNQSGMHALRFRERGPLKSWRPETMAEAIFAVLREGLSLSQAARKFDIPYPTFVLYANRVHNMLGPSADGSGGNDLLSDMRPKGRGRPQRILLGSWPEDHIRGVIRAVVFRDNGKDDLPFVFNRDPGLCGTSQSSSTHNGLDMSLHPQFGGVNPFLSLQQSHSNSTSTSASPNGNLNGTNPTGSGLGGLAPGALNDPGSAVQVEIGHSSSSNSPLDGLNCKGLGLSGPVDHHLSSRLLLSSTRHHQDRDTSALMLMGLGLKSKLLCESSGGPAELLKIKTELPFDDEEDLEDVPSEEEDDEDEKRRNSIQINKEKNANNECGAGLSSTIISATAPSQSAPPTPRRPSQHENEHEREVNTPSPQFQAS